MTGSCLRMSVHRIRYCTWLFLSDFRIGVSINNVHGYLTAPDLPNLPCPFPDDYLYFRHTAILKAGRTISRKEGEHGTSTTVYFLRIAGLECLMLCRRTTCT